MECFQTVLHTLLPTEGQTFICEKGSSYVAQANLIRIVFVDRDFSKEAITNILYIIKKTQKKRKYDQERYEGCARHLLWRRGGVEWKLSSMQGKGMKGDRENVWYCGICL